MPLERLPTSMFCIDFMTSCIGGGVDRSVHAVAFCLSNRDDQCLHLRREFVAHHTIDNGQTAKRFLRGRHTRLRDPVPYVIIRALITYWEPCT